MAAHLQKCLRLTSLFLRYNKTSRPIGVEVTSSLQRRQLSKDVDDKIILISKPSKSENGTEEQGATPNLDNNRFLRSQESSEDAGSGTEVEVNTGSYSEMVEKIESSIDMTVVEKGFLTAFTEYTAPEFLEPTKEEESFPTLFRKSKFVDLGDGKNRIVYGKIFHVVNDDLYVDFGWKFHCVITRPPKDGHLFVRNTFVRLLIKELEMSARFLGSTKDLTVNEADCQFLGLVDSPFSKSSRMLQDNKLEDYVP